MAVISLLTELYHFADLKLNLKFEIEILCKGKWIGPQTAGPAEVEVLCKARWIVVGPAIATGTRP